MMASRPTMNDMGDRMPPISQMLPITGRMMKKRMSPITKSEAPGFLRVAMLRWYRSSCSRQGLVCAGFK